MYLISLYFDDETNKRIEEYKRLVGKSTGNDTMLLPPVPPHITVAAFDTRNEESARKIFDFSVINSKVGKITFASVGTFLPSILYITPVLNEYLFDLSQKIYDVLKEMEDTVVRDKYRPYNWLPHATIGKNLTKEQMLKAFGVMQNCFGVFEGKITKIGLAKTNPYNEIFTFELPCS